MKTKSQVIAVVGLSLIMSLNVCAQSSPAGQRPSLDETKPVLKEVTQIRHTLAHTMRPFCLNLLPTSGHDASVPT